MVEVLDAVSWSEPVTEVWTEPATGVGTEPVTEVFTEPVTETEDSGASLIDSRLLEIRDLQEVNGRQLGDVVERLDVVVERLTESGTGAVAGCSAQVERMAADLRGMERVSVIILFAVGLLSGLVAGKIMWGRIHAG